VENKQTSDPIGSFNKIRCKIDKKGEHLISHADWLIEIMLFL